MINDSLFAFPTVIITLSSVVRQLADTNIVLAERTAVAQQILAWTAGQPELTEQLVDAVVQESAQVQSHARPATMVVNELVVAHFTPDLLSVEALSTSSNVRLAEILDSIQQPLLDDRMQGGRLLKYYQSVLLARHRIPPGYDDERQTLITLGLIRQDAQGKLKVANPIYRRIFSSDWVESQLAQPFVLKKGHWILLTSLTSILLFILLQSVFRYFPFAPSHRCVQSAELRDAIMASVSLSPEQMEQAIVQLMELNEQEQLSSHCQDVLYDLQYSYGIYVSASSHNNPLQAASYLCQIPESYYRKRNILPWFNRWSNVYRETSFSDDLDDYVEQHTCPAYFFLNRAS